MVQRGVPHLMLVYIFFHSRSAPNASSRNLRRSGTCLFGHARAFRWKFFTSGRQPSCQPPHTPTTLLAGIQTLTGCLCLVYNLHPVTPSSTPPRPKLVPSPPSYLSPSLPLLLLLRVGSYSSLALLSFLYSPNYFSFWFPVLQICVSIVVKAGNSCAARHKSRN